MRIKACGIVGFFVFWALTSWASAGSGFWGVPINASIGAGYLYGSQVISSEVDPTGDNVHVNVVFGFPTFSASLGIAPFNRLYFKTDVEFGSFGQQNVTFGPWWSPTSGRPDNVYSNARPGYVGLEGSGVFEIGRWPGYRIGIVSGWRCDQWWYEGLSTTDNYTSGHRNNTISNVPFFGFAAEMAYPGWRSNFELLTSRFVYETTQGSVHRAQQVGHYKCSGQDGFLFEARLAGQTNVATNLFLGLDGRFVYRTIPATFDGWKDSLMTRSLDVHIVENNLTLQMRLSISF